MCKVSNNLKLCSCKTPNVETLKHYWILHRPTEKNEFMIGEAIMPIYIEESIQRYNVTVLRKLLNEGECFDVDIKHQENDVLEFNFSFKPNPDKQFPIYIQGNYLAYAFVFKSGRWKKITYDPFENNLTRIRQGKILAPFK